MATIRLSTTMKKMWRNAFANYTSGDGAAKDYNVLFNWGGVIKIYAGTINDLGASTLLMTVTNAETTIETDGNNENIFNMTSIMGEANTTVSNSYPFDCSISDITICSENGSKKPSKDLKPNSLENCLISDCL